MNGMNYFDMIVDLFLEFFVLWWFLFGHNNIIDQSSINLYTYIWFLHFAFSHLPSLCSSHEVATNSDGVNLISVTMPLVSMVLSKDKPFISPTIDHNFICLSQPPLAMMFVWFSESKATIQLSWAFFIRWRGFFFFWDHKNRLPSWQAVINLSSLMALTRSIA